MIPGGQDISNYHVDGQIAKAIHGGKAENFLWDGLALIHRGETSFVNEPYVTGGNPILSSKQGVMFNDMLGNTLNVGGKSVSMTAFGETKDVDVLFTGKPYIGELGYAFLFRNYRADKGKWQTTDPLGYPDGWNNLAYVNNISTMAIDWLGGVPLFTSSSHSFNASTVWLIGYMPPPSISYDHIDVRGNDLVIYQLILTADGNNSGISGIQYNLNVTSSQTFGLSYVDNGEIVWTPSNITGTAQLATSSVAKSSKRQANGDMLYTATVTFYVYEKASGYNHQSSAPIKTYSLTLTHIVKE